MRLTVYYLDQAIGTLWEDDRDRLQFAYNQDALGGALTSGLSVRLPLREEPYDARAAEPFFENLLPEADTRDLVAMVERFDPSQTVRLLGSIGSECAGAVSLWPEGMHPPDPPAYEPCAPEDLTRFFDSAHTEEFVRAHLEGRQSMSGAQEKLVFLKEEGQYFLPLEGAPSNVLLKRERERFPGLLQNELLCLRLAEKAGMPVVASTACSIGPSVFETSRYDRSGARRDEISRLHQEDLCQAAGRRAAQKYESRGGPDLGQIQTVIRMHSSDPLTDTEHLARWTLANTVLGNNDGHAKNLSLLYLPEGIRLAPIYDVVCTEVYPFLGREFAIYLGGRPNLDALDTSAMRKLARTFGFRYPLLKQLAEEVIDRILDSLDASVGEVAALAGEHEVLETIPRAVRENAMKLSRRL